ncbi:MAG: hypothetical protein RLY58_463 [Pseudomonadota bacterium]|jgi:uncharacterized protein HemY
MGMNLSVLLLLFVLLFLAGAVLASAVMQDAGYVLLVWQGWQMQTSIGLLLVLLLSVVIVLMLGLLLLGSLVVWPQRRRRQQQAKQVAHQLRQFERAAVYRLFQNSKHAFDCLQIPQPLMQSSLLPLLQAGQALDAGLYTSAHESLARVPREADELAMLLHIRLALAENDDHIIRTRMQFLRTMPPDQARQQFEPVVLAYLDQLWVDWAVQQPWQALHHYMPAQLNISQWSQLLHALWLALPQAQEADHTRLQACFEAQSETQTHPNALAWVRVLVLTPWGIALAWQLLQQVLAHHFEPKLMPYLMLLARDFALPIGDQRVDELLNQLEARYPGQPSLRLAQARWQDAIGQPHQADLLAQDWPADCVSARLSILRELDRHPALQLPLSCAVYAFAFLGEC